jgi:MraZ protein
LFLGQFSCSFGKDDRLEIPAALAGPLKGGGYVTQGFDRNLLVLTEAAFEQVFRQVTALSLTDPLGRLLLRLILGTASELEMDGSGRVRLPDQLKGFARLEKNAVVIGQGDYLEIWSPDLWSRQAAEIQDAESNADRFAALNLATRQGTPE